MVSMIGPFHQLQGIHSPYSLGSSGYMRMPTQSYKPWNSTKRNSQEPFMLEGQGSK